MKVIRLINGDIYESILPEGFEEETSRLEQEYRAMEPRLAELERQSAAFEHAKSNLPDLWRLVQWLAKLGRGDEALPQSATPAA